MEPATVRVDSFSALDSVSSAGGQAVKLTLGVRCSGVPNTYPQEKGTSESLREAELLKQTLEPWIGKNLIERRLDFHVSEIAVALVIGLLQPVNRLILFFQPRTY